MIFHLNETDYYDCCKNVKKYNEGKKPIATVITFGCQQNEADSEQIKGIAEDMGYTLSDDYNSASLIIVNTCAIREHAVMKMLSLLGNFKAIKKRNPELIVGICGCVSAIKEKSDLIKKDFHYVTFTLEPNALHKIPTLVLKAIEKNRRSFIFGIDEGDLVEGLPRVRASTYSAWVSIMYGCNNFCSYCIVPYARGRERSRRSADIISECQALVSQGIKEITLLGQNVNSYRSDMDFPSLLAKIAELNGDFIIRFMTSHPKDVSDGLIAIMGKYRGKIAPYFHLPLQSGSNRILKVMNRTYDREKFLAIVRALREAVPDITLSTDVIIGFPSEGDSDFSDTMDIIERVKFDVAYSFLYSKREGTRAAEMDSQIPEEIKNERMKIFLDRQTEISYEKNLPFLGTRQRVLVDSRSKRGGENNYTGRCPSGKLVHFASEQNLIGEFADVEIEKIGAFDLFGKLIKNK